MLTYIVTFLIGYLISTAIFILSTAYFDKVPCKYVAECIWDGMKITFSRFVYFCRW